MLPPRVALPHVAARLDALPAFAPLLVFVFLVLLAVFPVLTQIRITRLRKEITDIADPARDLVTVLQVSLAMEAAGARGFVIDPDQDYAGVYRDAKRKRVLAYDRLLGLARRIGPPTSTDAEELGNLLAESDSLISGLFDGRMPVGRYIERLADHQAAFTRAVDMVARIDEALRDATAEQRNSIQSTARAGVAMTSVLVLLALAAAVVVARLVAERKRAAEERERLLEAEQAALVMSEEARERAEERRQQLERVTESRAGLIRGFSHDVKNPLAAADGYLALLEEGFLGPITEKQKQGVSGARRSIVGALGLIKSLIQVARAEALEIERAAVDLRTLTTDVVDEHRPMARAKGLGLSFEERGTVPNLQTDALRVRQILANLLSNAIKYTPRGSITVVVATRRKERGGRNGLWAVVDVRDTAPGISAERLPLVFLEFQRFDSTAGIDGAGIGLAISRRLARALGGDITVASEIGRGSTFTLWLPSESGDSAEDPILRSALGGALRADPAAGVLRAEGVGLDARSG